MAMTPQLPRGAIYNLLGVNNGKNCGHESFHSAEIVMDDFGEER